VYQVGKEIKRTDDYLFNRQSGRDTGSVFAFRPVAPVAGNRWVWTHRWNDGSKGKISSHGSKSAMFWSHFVINWQLPLTKIFEVIREKSSLLTLVEHKIPYGLSLDAFAKFRKATISFVKSVGLSIQPSVRPSAWRNESTWLPLDGFSWNLISDYF